MTGTAFAAPAAVNPLKAMVSPSFIRETTSCFEIAGYPSIFIFHTLFKNKNLPFTPFQIKKQVFFTASQFILYFIDYQQDR